MGRAVLMLYGVAALLALALPGVTLRASAAGRRLVYGGALVISGAMAAVALAQLLEPSAAPSLAWVPLGLPWQGTHFRLDALSAFFGFVTGLGGAAASLFALGYGRHEREPGRVLPFYPLFLAAMNLVVLADDAFTYLLSWEFMSLSSWALVMAHHANSDNSRAGYVYLVMATFGTLALLLCFGLLAGGGGAYTFDAMRASARGPAASALVLILALAGAGSKAGVVPLHAWLPLAHPAAPSQVSALMSGVMTKVAVYGFVRIVFDLQGVLPWWAGEFVLLAGGASAVLGVLHALMQDDLKRLLAWSHDRERRHRLHWHRPRARFPGQRPGRSRRARDDRRAVPRLQSLPVQESALLRRRRGTRIHGPARHGAARRTDPPNADDCARIPGRLHRDLGAAAAERVRLRMADIPGRTSEPGDAAVGAEVHGARRRRHAGTVGRARRRLLRQGFWHQLPRPPALARLRARPKRPTGSRSRPCSCLRRCASPPASCLAS